MRNSIVPPWLLETPIYGAALSEAGVLSIVILGGLAIRRRNSNLVDAAKPAPNPEVSAT